MKPLPTAHLNSDLALDSPILLDRGLAPSILNCLCVAALAMSGVVLPTGAVAGPVSLVEVSAGNFNPSQPPIWNPVSNSQSNNSVATAEVQTTRLDGSGSLAAHGFASSAYGVLKAAGNVSNDPGSTVRTKESASFSDTMRIAAAGLAGQHGEVRLSITFNWLAEGNSLGNPRVGDLSAELQMLLWAKPDFFSTVQASRRDIVDYNYNGTGTMQYSASKNGQPIAPTFEDTLEIVVPFVVGVDFEFGATLSTLMDAGNGDWQGAVSADHSAYWSGIQDVVIGGQHISNFSVSSNSGTDWRQSFVPASVGQVPEPASLLLACLGLLAAGQAGRRRPLV